MSIEQGSKNTPEQQTETQQFDFPYISSCAEEIESAVDGAIKHQEENLQGSLEEAVKPAKDVLRALLDRAVYQHENNKHEVKMEELEEAIGEAFPYKGNYEEFLIRNKNLKGINDLFRRKYNSTFYFGNLLSNSLKFLQTGTNNMEEYKKIKQQYRNFKREEIKRLRDS